MYKELDKRIDEILSGLTLKQKIGQLNQVQQPLNADAKKAVLERIRNGEVGSIIMAASATAGNDEQQAVKVKEFNDFQKCAVEESESGIPIIFGRDVIHGHHTVMPIPLASAAAFNSELVEEAYRCVAKEAAAENIHWTFSPMLDVCHEPRWGRIIEGPGEDPFVASSVARATVKGFQGDDLSDENSLAACAKHFIGYGASEGGRDYHRTEISDYTMYNMILPPFNAAVEAGVATVMSSFNDINGEPVTSSKKYLTKILREQLGFEGFVVTDWATVNDLVRQGACESLSEAAKAAIEAGVDMDMVSGVFANELEKLVTNGEVSMDVIDNAVRNVLRIKLAKGLFEKPYCRLRTVDKTEHLKIARELAAESMVLLKNDNNTLPLKRDMTVSVGGPFLRERRALLGSWTLDGDEDATPNFLEAVQAVKGSEGRLNIGIESPILTHSESAYMHSDAVVLCLGESHHVTGEARSVADISISAEQVELARRAKRYGKKVIGVIFCGRPLALEKIEPYLDAILCAWHCGSETAFAAAEIIFGDRVPSGKTPVTFLRTTGQIPLYYNATPPRSGCTGYYGPTSERNYCDTVGTPLYPFGYGLSYTKFNISPISVSDESLSLDSIKSGASFKFTVDVENVGNFTGKEVVQLYIRDKVSTIIRPWRELKALKKLEISAGEKEQVTFDIGFKDLGYYLPNGEFTLEKGEFDIYIGNNCKTVNKITIKVV